MTSEEKKLAIDFIRTTISKYGDKMPYSESIKEIAASLVNDFGKDINVSAKVAELEKQILFMVNCNNCEWGKGIMCSNDKRCMTDKYENWELRNE